MVRPGLAAETRILAALWLGAVLLEKAHCTADCLGSACPAPRAPGVVMLQQGLRRQRTVLVAGQEAEDDADARNEQKRNPNAQSVCRPGSVDLDFANSNLVQNNLGGRGPDSGPEEMRFRGVVSDYEKIEDHDSGAMVDMVVTATSSYQPMRIQSNDRIGPFANINLKSGRKVDLRFRFENAETHEPVVLDTFEITFFDLDHGRQAADKERLTLSGFDSYQVVDGHELNIEDQANSTAFSSTGVGHGCDNPKDPMHLGEVTCKGQTVDQMKRSVMVLYSNLTHFDATFEVSQAGCWGRNLLFAGASSLAELCPSVPSTAPTTSAPPTTSPPTTSPPPKTRSPKGLCVLWGDPHVNVFDNKDQRKRGSGANVRMLNHGDYWIVRSEDILIQGRYWSAQPDGASSMRALAVGGPFLNNKSIIVGPTGDGQVTWNGSPILTEFPSEYEETDLFAATFHDSDRSLDAGLSHIALRTVELELPKGVRLTVNRWPNHVDAMISMDPQPNQDGHCGNFNGDLSDDTLEQIRARMSGEVPQDMNMFTRRAFEHVGCFLDDVDNRDLPQFKGSYMKTGECGLACQDSEYFGLQGTRECRCGDVYGRLGEAQGCDCEADYIGDVENCVYRYEGSPLLPIEAREVQLNLAMVDDEKREHAQEICGKALGDSSSSDVFYENCVFDVYFGGDEFAEQSAAAQKQTEKRIRSTKVPHQNMNFEISASEGMIRWFEHPEFCFSLEGDGEPQIGTRVVIAKCDGVDKGRATFTLPSNGLGPIHLASHPNFCMDVAGGTRTNGTPIQIWYCQGDHPNMQFEVPEASGSIRWALAPDFCLDVSAGVAASGTQIQTWTCN